MSKVFSRRNLLIGASVVAVGAGTTIYLTQGQGSARKLPTPALLSSEGGQLSVELEVAAVEKKIAKSTVSMIGYNGSVPGPTLKVRPGDTVKLKLVNKLGEATNLHTHGLFVHPNENSDNPFVHVMPGESFDYQFEIPKDHAEGTHWYHPHLHGQVANQVFGGLYGTIIVEDDTTPKVSEDRVLVISDASFKADGTLAKANAMDQMMGREGDYLLVNGELQPSAETKNKSLERWRIVNACVSRNLSLQIVGGTATLLGIDGHKFDAAENFDTRILAPGNRADVLVEVASSEVSLRYTTVPHEDAGMMGMSSEPYKDYPLVTFKAAGTAEKITKQANFKAAADLRKANVNSKRKFVLAMPDHAMAMGAASMANLFTINGQAFDHDRIDTTVSNNTVEEWTIANTSTMQHPFHLHIWPMQLVSENGKEVSGVRYQDVVSVPANGEVVVRVNFHTHTGKTLYHCHILDHEDLGMMGVIQSV